MIRTLSLNILAVLSLAAALLVSSANTNTARAVSVPAVTFTDASFPGDGGNYSLGYQFTPNTNIKVTALGYFDGPNGVSGFGGDGLGGASEIGIYLTSTMSLVSGASVTVPSGVAGTLVGNGANGFYRYASLTTPVMLTAGTTYRIAGTTSNGANFYAWEEYDNFAANPNITVGSGYYSGTAGSVVYPNILSPYTGSPIFAGGNFLFELPIPAPEPSSAMLLLSGTALLSMVRRHRRSRR